MSTRALGLGLLAVACADNDAQLHLDAVTYNAGSENVALLALVTRLHQTTLRV